MCVCVCVCVCVYVYVYEYAYGVMGVMGVEKCVIECKRCDAVF